MGLPGASSDQLSRCLKSQQSPFPEPSVHFPTASGLSQESCPAVPCVPAMKILITCILSLCKRLSFTEQRLRLWFFNSKDTRCGLINLIENLTPTPPICVTLAISLPFSDLPFFHLGGEGCVCDKSYLMCSEDTKDCLCSMVLSIGFLAFFMGVSNVHQLYTH